MNLAPNDRATVESMVRLLASMQKTLDGIRDRMPRDVAGAEPRLALAIAIVNLERTESTLRELQT